MKIILRANARPDTYSLTSIFRNRYHLGEISGYGNRRNCWSQLRRGGGFFSYWLSPAVRLQRRNVV